jgi:hypothetical protein
MKTLLPAGRDGLWGVIHSDRLDAGGQEQSRENATATANIQDWGGLLKHRDKRPLRFAKVLFAAAKLVKADRLHQFRF